MSKNQKGKSFMSNKNRQFFLRVIFILLFFSAADSLVAQSPVADSSFLTAEGLVNGLYKAVTFKAGNMPDWNRVKSMFLNEAVIVLRSSRDSTTVFDVNGFVKDFVDFTQKYHVDKTGFMEKVIRMKPMVFGEMAHVLVLYEASVPGTRMPPQGGVDSFSLIRKNSRWWIASITNEIPTKERPLPPELRVKK